MKVFWNFLESSDNFTGITRMYLGHRQTSTVEIFCGNTVRLLAVKYFRETGQSWMFDMVLNTP